MENFQFLRLKKSLHIAWTNFRTGYWFLSQGKTQEFEDDLLSQKAYVICDYLKYSFNCQLIINKCISLLSFHC